MVDYNKPSEKCNKPEKANKEELKIERVVVGEVITRKKPLTSRLRETFFGGEAKMVVQYIGAEVLLPALRNLLYDTLTKGGSQLIYGNDSPRHPQSRTNYAPHMTYGPAYAHTNYNKKVGSHPVYTGFRASKGRGGMEEWILPTRQEAQATLSQMQDILDVYDVVSVADLKEMLGVRKTYVDDNWGWVYLQDAAIKQIREGYLLQLPPPEEIN